MNKSSKKLLHCAPKKAEHGISESASLLLIANNEAIGSLVKRLVPKQDPNIESSVSEVNRPILVSSVQLVKKIAKHSIQQVRKLMFKLLERYTQIIIA